MQVIELQPFHQPQSDFGALGVVVEAPEKTRLTKKTYNIFRETIGSKNIGSKKQNYIKPNSSSNLFASKTFRISAMMFLSMGGFDDDDDNNNKYKLMQLGPNQNKKTGNEHIKLVGDVKRLEKSPGTLLKEIGWGLSMTMTGGVVFW